jgi:probable O-glycosylation ligase (exosortase A-associated)
MTKHLLFMIAVTLLGSVGVYVLTPFCGVAVYTFFAVLRPQFIWDWSLPEGWAWSFYVAIPTIIAAILVKLGVMSAGPPKMDGTRFTGAWSVAHTMVLIFAGWVVVTYATAFRREIAFITLQEYLKIFVMFVVSSVLVRTPRQVWGLCVLTTSSLAYIAYDVNYKYFVDHYLGIFHNGYGGLDNNGAGLMLAMSVPLCYFIWEGWQNHAQRWLRWFRWLYLLFIPVVIHAVLCTYSRGSMVAMLGSVPFIFLYSRKKVFLSGLVLVMAFFVIPALAGKEIRARFFSIEQNDVDASAQSRRDSWNAAWLIAKNHPLFGVGVRNSPLLTKQYGADMEGRVVHNQYLQLAADTGFPGLAIYLGCLVSVFWACFRVRHSLKRQDYYEAQRDSAVASGVSCSLILCCIGATFLSIEVCELPYVLMFLGVHLRVLVLETFSPPSAATTGTDHIPDYHLSPVAESLSVSSPRPSFSTTES